jgi:glutathione peroxidase-family protein
MAVPTLYDFSFTVNTLTGKPFPLSAMKGTVLLIVNVASQVKGYFY